MKPIKIDLTDGIKIYYSENEWVLVRASGTEPYIRIFSESKDDQERAEYLATTTKNEIDELVKIHKDKEIVMREFIRSKTENSSTPPLNTTSPVSSEYKINMKDLQQILSIVKQHGNEQVKNTIKNLYKDN